MALMPKNKKNIQAKKVSPNLSLAGLMLILGIIGLIWAWQQSEPINLNLSGTKVNNLELKVESSANAGTGHSQGEAADRIQQAAKVKDLIKGRDGNNIQEGSSVDSLTQDKVID